MAKDSRFEELLKHHRFMNHVINLVFDEAHVIKEWGKGFRPEYTRLGVYRYLMARRVPIHLGSATLPPTLVTELRYHLNLAADTHIFRLDTDRKNIFLRVHRMQHPANSYLDLVNFVPKPTSEAGPRAKKFLMFFNSRTECEDAAEVLRQRLGRQYQHRIKWVHSGMTDEFRSSEVHALQVGSVDGECATDAVGMVSTYLLFEDHYILLCMQGIDIPDIYQVVQYRVPSSLSTWWQRAGRAVRNLDLDGTAILISEPSHFDDEKAKAAIREETKRTKSNEAKIALEEKAKRLAAEVQTEMVNVNGKRPSQEEVKTAPVKKKRRGKDGEVVSKHAQAATKTVDAFGRDIKVEAAMDDFLNAEHRPSKCRRRVVGDHLGNKDLGPSPSLASFHFC